MKRGPLVHWSFRTLLFSLYSLMVHLFIVMFTALTAVHVLVADSLLVGNDHP